MSSAYTVVGSLPSHSWSSTFDSQVTAIRLASSWIAQNGSHRKLRFQLFFYCSVFIRYLAMAWRSSLFTVPLPSNRWHHVTISICIVVVVEDDFLGTAATIVPSAGNTFVLHQSHFCHHKSSLDWSGIESRHVQYRTSDQPSGPCKGQISTCISGSPDTIMITDQVNICLACIVTYSFDLLFNHALSWKLKVKFPLCLSTSSWRLMRDWKYSSVILNLNIGWNWAVSFTHQPTYPRGTSQRYP